MKGLPTRIWVGLESESVRVRPDGSLSSSSHPSSLEGEGFTKDFSESQLEIVTPPRASVEEALEEMGRMVREAEGAIGEELLWPFSMPPAVASDDEIPIARFGGTPEGRKKKLYRIGLASRYGRRRQLISGVHVNCSFTAAGGVSSEDYLNGAAALYTRLPQLLLLSGASPLASPFFTRSCEDPEPVLSLRNSPLGYSGSVWENFLSLDSLSSYIRGIEEGLHRVHEPFRHMGVVRGGEVIQLNDKVFQSEKEFYAPVRLRQNCSPGQSELDALKDRGVGYVEVRFPDKDPWSPGGVNGDVVRLILLTLLYGMLHPPRRNGEMFLWGIREARRIGALPLRRLETAWVVESAREMLKEYASLAKDLDSSLGTDGYSRTIETYLHTLTNPQNLPAWRLYNHYRSGSLHRAGFGLGNQKNRQEGEAYELHYTGV